MKKLLLVFLFALPVVACAQEYWLGLFLKEKKIGYSSSLTTNEKVDGREVTRDDTHTMMSAGLMGTAMTIDMKSSTWSSNGRPTHMVFRMESSGRVQHLDAVFGSKSISIEVENGGSKTKATIPLPKDGTVVDDALGATLVHGKHIGQTRVLYVLDPLTVSLVKNTVTVKGEENVIIRGKTVRAQRVDIDEVRAVTRVFLNAHGDIVKAEGPMGIEMIPLTRAQALAPSAPSGGFDLAEASSINCDQDISDPAGIKVLKLRISGRDLSRLPSDEHQTVRRDGDSWLVDVHPVEVAKAPAVQIAAAAREKPAWTRPSMYISSDRTEFKALAKKIVTGPPTVTAAARKIQLYVYEHMRFNSGIGVLRNASEVLRTKEGVCRDYAVLTATLLRAAGVPARVASGIVYADGKFFYHAWAEAWDGRKWFGVDSTRPAQQITATHVKLADGNVDDAFLFTFLGDAKIDIQSIER